MPTMNRRTIQPPTEIDLNESIIKRRRIDPNILTNNVNINPFLLLRDSPLTQTSPSINDANFEPFPLQGDSMSTQTSSTSNDANVEPFSLQGDSMSKQTSFTTNANINPFPFFEDSSSTQTFSTTDTCISHQTGTFNQNISNNNEIEQYLQNHEKNTEKFHTNFESNNATTKRSRIHTSFNCTSATNNSFPRTNVFDETYEPVFESNSTSIDDKILSEKQVDGSILLVIASG